MNLNLLRVAVLFFFACVCAQNALGSEYIFPEVADGKSSNQVYMTTFLLNNVLDSRNTIVVSFFQSGSPWTLGLRSHDRADITGRSSSFTIVLEPRETVNIFTAAEDPITVGWAKIQSTAPLDVSEIFSVFRSDLNPQMITSEAGVLPSPTSAQFSFEANYSPDETVGGTLANTGYAIANPNSSAVTVTARLFSRTGVLLSEKLIPLNPNAQLAEYVNQRFSDVSLSGHFHGTLRLSSDANVAVCALRDSSSPNGDVFSTVAVNSDLTLGYHIVNDREPNNGTGSAQQISLPAEIIGSKNAADNASDADYFAVSLQAGQTLYVMAVADIIGSAYDGDIYLRDSAGNQIGARYDYWANGLRDPGFSYTVTTAGTYYIHIASRTGTNTSGASYRLFVMAR